MVTIYIQYSFLILILIFKFKDFQTSSPITNILTSIIIFSMRNFKLGSSCLESMIICVDDHDGICQRR